MLTTPATICVVGNHVQHTFIGGDRRWPRPLFSWQTGISDLVGTLAACSVDDFVTSSDQPPERWFTRTGSGGTALPKDAAAFAPVTPSPGGVSAACRIAAKAPFSAEVGDNPVELMPVDTTTFAAKLSTIELIADSIEETYVAAK